MIALANKPTSVAVVTVGLIVVVAGGFEARSRRVKLMSWLLAGPTDGETRIRTGDTTIFSRVLYQLSYLALAARC
jgi:hypothetical protein